jgi:hypothetical protein
MKGLSNMISKKKVALICLLFAGNLKSSSVNSFEQRIVELNDGSGSHKMCLVTVFAEGAFKPALCDTEANGSCPSFPICLSRSGVSGGGDGGAE